MSNNTADAILSGSRLALARLLSQIENADPACREAQDILFQHSGRAYLIGISGAPGTGKSTLVNQLIQAFRKPAGNRPTCRVAVVAVDASSPFSGGAVLGDRIRMRSSAGDPGVFIRSMSARGALGGLARTTHEMADVLDAAGYEIILIETVGVGQSEVDIAALAHTTIIVESPGQGDDVQAIKAGIFEIADIFVINKADRPGVNSTETALRGMLDGSFALKADTAGYAGRGHQALESDIIDDIVEGNQGWTPPILKTIATENQGIDAVINAIYEHRQYLNESGDKIKREIVRLKHELDASIMNSLYQSWQSQMDDVVYQQVLDEIFHRNKSPHQAALELLT